MAIESFRTAVLDPTATAITAPRFSISSVHNVTVRLTDESGVSGIGYAYVFDEHSAAAIKNMIEEFAPAYVGSEAQDLRRVRTQLLTTKVNFLGVFGLVRLAAAALDMAAWDLLCRLHETNLVGLLGAERSAQPALSASGLWAGIPPEELATIAKDVAADLGTPNAKMWVNSTDLGWEVERVAAAAEALGPEGGLVVDAAQAYDWRTAARLANKLTDIDNILWFEDPVEYDDLEGHRAFAAESSLPMGTGEHIYGLDQLKRLLDTGAPAVVSLDLERIGGITDFLAAAGVCEAYRTTLASHCFPHVSVQVLATARTGHWCELAPLWDGFFGKPPVADGFIQIEPDTLGIGLEPLVHEELAI